ncbi:MAG: hypothetical protein HOL48_00395 [Porticoccaceae bacterium]|jgi:hypothetical protein|nr:hypothetical protein [Porticoccaceae bacterium]
MNKLTITSACLAGLLFAGEAAAQGGMGDRGDRPQRPDFATLDANSDGLLSLEEVQAMAATRGDQTDDDRARNMDNFFGRMDSDADGMLSEEEFTAIGNRGRDGDREGRGDGRDNEEGATL